MELGVTQPRLCDPIQRWRRNHAPKRAVDAIALIVGHDEQHVGASSAVPRAAATTASNPWRFP